MPDLSDENPPVDQIPTEPSKDDPFTEPGEPAKPTQNTTNSTQSHTFLNSQGEKLFTLTFDKDFGIDQFSIANKQDYIELKDNPQNSGSQTNVFTYFPNEQSMTKYFQGNETHDYDLSYPLTDKDKNLNKPYIYYHSDGTSAPHGMFYDRDYSQKVDGFRAALITSYHNLAPSGPALYDPDSSLTDTSYCVIDIFDIDYNSTGYLVFSGKRSAGSTENFCKTLLKLDSFDIQLAAE
ncbi:hypothetical protein GF357_04000 [Candidatus Dojkabacteria bacterium]|nr:hypothetical protein [Candidatus Dojkabacteria bacterium]